MSNRYMTQFPLAFEKQVKRVFAKVTFQTTGAPVLDAANSKGVKSITRNGTGDYTFVFGSNSQIPIIDTYVKLLAISRIYNSGSSVPAAPGAYIKTNSISTFGTGSINMITTNSSNAAADPVSGEIGYFEFTFGDSSSG